MKRKNERDQLYEWLNDAKHEDAETKVLAMSSVLQKKKLDTMQLGEFMHGVHRYLSHERHRYMYGIAIYIAYVIICMSLQHYGYHIHPFAWSLLRAGLIVCVISAAMLIRNMQIQTRICNAEKHYKQLMGYK